MGNKNKVQRTTVKKPADTKRAITITEQGPRDDLTRVDGYGKHVGPQKTQFSETLNKYADDFFASYNGLTDALGFKKIDLKSLNGLKGIGEAIKSLEPDKLLKRIEESTLGRTINSLIDINNGFKEEALKELEKLSKGTNAGGLNISQAIRLGKMSYDDANRIYNSVKDGDWHSLAGIKKGVDIIAGGNGPLSSLLKDTVDLHAVSAFLGSSIKAAARFGNSKLVNKIIDLFNDKKILNRALGSTLYNAAERADLDMVTLIVDTIGKNLTKDNYPQAINKVLRNYRHPAYYTPHMLNDFTRKLLDALNKLNPAWYYIQLFDEKVTRLDVFYRISSDAKSLLLNAKELGEYDFSAEITIANSYPAMDIKTLTMKLMKDISLKK